MAYDVAIIGGGPAGSTAGTLLKKYNPKLNVLILEREQFPRDHVGESQLPEVGRILNEMGAWDKVEAAGFPIKIGATYKWGTTDELWDFEFVPGDKFNEIARPAKYEGQRAETAFQVDRAIYDYILLKHAESLGCEVRQSTRVTQIQREGDRIMGLELGDGSTITATHYVDASGHGGVIRRAMGVQTEAPTTLQNIAIWDYWQNAEWAVSIGVGGTRVQVMSLGYGWIWFIPLGPTRTSVGLIVPASYYKTCGMKPAELYAKALAEEPLIADLLRNAQSESNLQTTKDWSFLASRMAGENWFLAGESAGFADPILAAGMTLAHTGAREVAYTILELERGNHDPQWLRDRYEEAQRMRIGQHIRFADFWYTANGRFTDLKEFCSQIAADAGLTLNADQAFQWLGTGGFANDTVAGNAGIGTLSIESLKIVLQRMTATKANWKIAESNIFRLDLEGATEGNWPLLENGRIEAEPCYWRNGKRLNCIGLFGLLVNVLEKHSAVKDIINELLAYFNENPWLPTQRDNINYVFHVLETMVVDGWVIAERDPELPTFKIETLDEVACIHNNRDNRQLQPIA